MWSLLLADPSSPSSSFSYHLVRGRAKCGSTGAREREVLIKCTGIKEAWSEFSVVLVKDHQPLKQLLSPEEWKGKRKWIQLHSPPTSHHHDPGWIESGFSHPKSIQLRFSLLFSPFLCFLLLNLFRTGSDCKFTFLKSFLRCRMGCVTEHYPLARCLRVQSHIPWTWHESWWRQCRKSFGGQEKKVMESERGQETEWLTARSKFLLG